jgi:hypothetical protein
MWRHPYYNNISRLLPDWYHGIRDGSLDYNMLPCGPVPWDYTRSPQESFKIWQNKMNGGSPIINEIERRRSPFLKEMERRQIRREDDNNNG